MSELLISKMQERLPAHIKPVTYLMEALDLGRESAYRRLRGDILFSLHEAATLAKDLGFSLDDVALGKTENNSFAFTNLKDSGADTFLDVLKNYSKSMDIKSEQPAEIIVSQNRIVMSSLLADDCILRYYYFKFLHQYDYVAPSHTFSDTFVPEKILAFRNNLLKRKMNFHYTYLFNKYYISSICNEIRYYNRANLIKDRELLLLKNAVQKYMDSFKVMSITPNIGGLRRDMYVSMLDIPTNSISITYGEKVISHFWIFPLNFMETQNSSICNVHKTYLNMIKKYSILISHSNALFREKFFEQQQEYIDSITEPLIWF